MSDQSPELTEKRRFFESLDQALKPLGFVRRQITYRRSSGSDVEIIDFDTVRFRDGMYRPLLGVFLEGLEDGPSVIPKDGPRAMHGVYSFLSTVSLGMREFYPLEEASVEELSRRLHRDGIPWLQSISQGSDVNYFAAELNSQIAELWRVRRRGL